jgi:hypothetical protein
MLPHKMEFEICGLPLEFKMPPTEGQALAELAF